MEQASTWGALHGYAIARRIEQVAGGERRLSRGAVYPALIGLQQQGWIRTKWRMSESNRRVKVFELTAAGTRQLHRRSPGGASRRRSSPSTLARQGHDAAPSVAQS